MNPYIAQFVYRIDCDGLFTDQYEQQWRLIYAPTAQEGLKLALQVGNNEANTFVDRHGRTIKWELLAVKDIQPIMLTHGSLLFSQIHEQEMVPAPLWAAEV